MSDEDTFTRMISAVETGESWTVMKDGKPVAVVISYAEYERFKSTMLKLATEVSSS